MSEFIGIIVVIAIVIGIVSLVTSIERPSEAQIKQEHLSAQATRLSNTMTYYRDTRTNLCFARATSDNFTSVNCDNLTAVQVTDFTSK